MTPTPEQVQAARSEAASHLAALSVLAEKRDAALAQVAALREALARAERTILHAEDDQDTVELVVRTLAAPEQAAREHDERVRADERKACAKVADAEHAACWHAGAMAGANAAKRIAAAIRGRKP